MLSRKKLKNMNLDLLLTICVSLMLGIFGVFISHYNSDRFIDGYYDAETIITSRRYANKVESKRHKKTKTVTLDVKPTTINNKSSILIEDLNRSCNTTTDTKCQTDTSRSNIFQTLNLDFPNFMFPNPNVFSTPTELIIEQ